MHQVLLSAINPHILYLRLLGKNTQNTIRIRSQGDLRLYSVSCRLADTQSKPSHTKLLETATNLGIWCCQHQLRIFLSTMFQANTNTLTMQCLFPILSLRLTLFTPITTMSKPSYFQGTDMRQCFFNYFVFAPLDYYVIWTLENWNFYFLYIFIFSCVLPVSGVLDYVINGFQSVWFLITIFFLVVLGVCY